MLHHFRYGGAFLLALIAGLSADLCVSADSALHLDDVAVELDRLGNDDPITVSADQMVELSL